ncbi:hypothetical protein Gpo141_00011518 [Globisporangium polare]
MGVCPSGDCAAGQAINLALSRLEEIDASSTLVVKAEKFNQTNGTWVHAECFDRVAIANDVHLVQGIDQLNQTHQRPL